MNSPFQFFDIFILIIIAIVVLTRLKDVLGKRTGDSQSTSFKHINQETKEKVVHLNPSRLSLKDQSIEQLRSIDPNFNEREFLNGAKRAFEIINEAFIQKDKEALRPLLSPDVFQRFCDAMPQESGSLNQVTKIMGIHQAHIESIKIEKRFAHICVIFVSEKVLENPDQTDQQAPVIEHKDQWTFVRNLQSSDPNWQLIKTQHIH